MKRILKLISLALGISLLAVLVMPIISVLAIDDPDDPPQVDDVLVYEDLLEDGDIGILINYYIDYTIAGTPTEPVTESYLAIFVDIDGTTQLKAVAPYTFHDNGYYRGLVWIYFDAAEVVTHSIDSANEALYRVWLTGNPTVASGWDGDPPLTVAAISDWYTTGDSAVLLAQQVLSYADMLELAWSPLDMIEVTGLGNRLTTTGVAYFANVIANLQEMAPACFADVIYTPTIEDIDYSVAFGAIATSGTSAVTGSPLTLTSGANTITVNAPGTFTLDLEAGTYGTIEDGTATIAVSPSNIIPGANVITITGGAAPGTVIVNVGLTSTQQAVTDIVSGTGFDLTNVAAAFGMSRLAFSGAVWTLVTILICAGAYAGTRRQGGADAGRAGSITMLFFTFSFIGGALLGMLPMVVIALLGVGYGAFIGYILFFRTSADIGRQVMFMLWMWLIVSIVGGICAGSVTVTSTRLTADLTAIATTVTVNTTEGFPQSGVIVINDEKIAYSNTTGTTFIGTIFRPVIRGQDNTIADAHLEGARVRTVEGMLINGALNYNVALIAEASGLTAIPQIASAVWDIIITAIALPLSFLGTDLVILTWIWGIIGVGVVVSVGVTIISGTRIL